MTYSFRDYFFDSPYSRSREATEPKEEPSKLPEGLRIFPSPNPNNPFGGQPKIQPQQNPFRIWDDSPTVAPIVPPTLPFPPLPSLPTPNPFPDPTKPSLPPIFRQQTPPSFDVNPSDFPGRGESEPAGGLLGRLLALHMQQSHFQPIVEQNGQPPEAEDAVPSRRLVARFDLSDPFSNQH